MAESVGGLCNIYEKKIILESAYLDLQIVSFSLKLMFVVAAIVFPHS